MTFKKEYKLPILDKPLFYNLMITKEQLKILGFYSGNESHLYYNDQWEYEFNILTNELLHYNDGFPADEPFVTILNYNHFKEVLQILYPDETYL